MNPLEIVREAYAAWNRGDIRPALRHMHPDVEWRSSGMFPGLSPLYRGHHGVLRWQRDLTTPFERFVVTIVNARVQDDVVTAHVHFDAVGATSGAQVELEFLNEWRFEHGLVVEFRATPVR